MSPDALSPHSRLTPRQRAAVLLLAADCTPTQAAVKVGISTSAFDHRVKNARERLGCATTARLMFLLGREAGAAGRHR